jgi:hypothetical protein
MMTCNNFRLLWTEWHEGYLSELSAMRLHWHIEACPQCREYNQQMLALVNGLNTLPEPNPLPEESSIRMIANAKSGDRQKRDGESMRVWALAASLIVTFIGGGLFWSHMHTRALQIPATSLPGSTAAVTLVPNRIQTVRLVLEARRNISEVTFTINLPEGVEIAGYPGQQQLRWEGHLDKGRNGLALPLIAKPSYAGFSGKNSILIAQIEYGNNQQALEVPLDFQAEETGASRPDSGIEKQMVAMFDSEARDHTSSDHTSRRWQ